MNKPLSEDELYRSFRAAEAYFVAQEKKGAISREKASELISKAKHNYSSQNYNRQLDKCGIKK